MVKTSFCPRCNQHLPRNCFLPNRGKEANADGLQSYCRDCTNAYARARRPKTIAKHLVWSSRARAKERNIPHTITDADVIVPEVCPALGIPLKNEGSQADNSPSLDRVIPQLGYVPGNVVVISKLANRIKSNATPDQLRKVAQWAQTLT